MNNPLYLSPHSLNHCLRDLLLTARHIEDTLKDILAQYGLSLKHYRILLCLANEPPLSPTMLQKKLCLHKQSLHEAMINLRDDDYVTITASRRDHRIKLFSLSEKGNILWNDIFTKCSSMQVMQSVFQEAKQQQVQDYQIIAEKLYDSLDANALK